MLIALDFDGVIATTDPFVHLAETADAGEEVAAIMDRLWNEELAYAEGLRMATEHVAGLPVEDVTAAFDSLQMQPGTSALVEAIHRADHETAIVSDAPKRAVRSCLDPAEFDVDTIVANRLRTANEALTGDIEGPLVGQRKDEALKQLAVELEVPLANTVAVGDDWRDLPMLQAAELGIGLDPDPVVKRQCDHSVPSLDRLEMRLAERNII